MYSVDVHIAAQAMILSLITYLEADNRLDFTGDLRMSRLAAQFKAAKSVGHDVIYQSCHFHLIISGMFH